MSRKRQYSGESTDKMAARPRFGLRLKLLVVISVLILSVSSFFAAYFARIMSTNMIRSAEEDVGTLSNILATSIELGLWARDKSLLKGPALGVCNHSLVRYVAIYDASGEPLVVCKGAALGRPQSTAERRQLPEEVRDELQQTIRRVDVDRVVDGVPVRAVYLRITHAQAETGTEDELSLFGGDDQMATSEAKPDPVGGEGQNAREFVVSGFAEIEASLGWMRAERARIVRSSVIIALAGFCVAVMLNLMLSRKITSPLAALVRGTERVGEGDLEYRIGLRTNDEIGLLAHSFDKMADQLNESRRQIEEYSRNLERKVAERTAELEASENRFRSVFESSPIGILTADKDGVVTGVNEAYLRIIGGEGARDRIVGKFNLRDAEVFRRAGIEQCFTQLFEGYPFDIEAAVTSMFGKELILRYLGVPLFDSLGHVSGAVAMVEDIAERKRAEEALRIKDSAIESSINAIAIADLEGSMTYVNPSFLRLWGYDDDKEVLGKPNVSFWQEADKAAEVVEALRQSGSWVGELIAVRKDGSTFDAQLSANMVKDEAGEPVCMMSSFMNITERKRAEEELLKAKNAAEGANRELETTNEQLEQAIERANQMASAAEAANVAKSEFLANMSHEIRTPLNGMIGMTDLALDTELSAEQRECLETAKKCADSLLVLINEVLDFSKVEAGRVEIENIDFDLRTSVEGVGELLASKASEKGLELAVHVKRGVPESVRGDPGRLRQVLVNLAANAIKFTDRGEVVISAEVEGRDDGKARVRFSVTDTGIGIPEGKHGLIFDTFRQADGSTTREYGGTGLGLAISRQLVELMGGRIWLESEPGKGSTFHFTVPFVEGLPKREPMRRASYEDIRGMLVLVVDDNRTARTILHEMLCSFGCRTLEAASGSEGLELLERASSRGETVQFALLDANLPDMSGFKVAQLIRQDKSLHAVRLIMLTSVGRRGDAARAQEAGISAYLTKPVKQSQLLDAIVTVLGHQQDRESTRQCLVTRHTLAEDKRKHGVRILLAEDNPVNQKVAERMLTKAGYLVGVANNGIEVLGALERDTYDLVLMDVQMPEMDGFEATTAIRSDKRWKGIPVVAMTAHAMEGDKQRCLNAGMDDYLAKPIDAQELLSTIEKWAGKGSTKAMVGVKGMNEQRQDPIDVEGALERFGGDFEFLREIVDEFLALAPDQLTTIRTGVASGDATKVEHTAHTLKGAAANISAEQVRDMALRLERMGRAGDLSAAQASLPELEAELKRLKVFAGAKDFHRSG